MICNAEAVSVEAAAKEYAGRATFIGVAWSGGEAEFQEFVDRHGLTFPQISDEPGEVFARFDLVYQPAAVIVAPDGSVETLIGEADGEAISAAVDAALG